MPQRIIANHESEVPFLKRVGVIGGMGQWATLDILNRIFRASVDFPVPQYGNRGYPPMDIRMVNKAPMILNSDGSYPDALDPSPTLLEAAKFVGKNSDFLICTSNTAHIFAKEIEKAAGKPLLSLVDVAIQEAKRRNCRRVGVMAIGVTLREGLFQGPLKKIGVESVLLPVELGYKLDEEGIYPVQQGGDPQEFSKVACDAIDY
ncbi:MAG: Aspartate racemase, partial [candidate division CPR2 bacterium GW2011_GWD2_39_7]